MSVLDMWGFEWGQDNLQVDYEGITFNQGTFAYENTASSPPGKSAFFIRTTSSSQARGTVIPSALPSGDEFWLHFLWNLASPDTASDLNWVAWKQGGSLIGHGRVFESRGLLNLLHRR